MSELSVQHVGITVSDLEKTLAFYRDTLGLPIVDRFEVGGEAFVDSSKLRVATGWWTEVSFGNGVRRACRRYAD